MFRLGFALLFTLAFTLPIFAGNPSIRLMLTGGVFPPGQEFQSIISLDNPGMTGIDSWTYGVCHDNTAIELKSISNGSSFGFGPGMIHPDQNFRNITPDGFTQNVVIDFQGVLTFPTGDNLEIAVLTYQNNLIPSATTTINFCNTLGTPPLEIEFFRGGSPTIPQTTGATISRTAGTPNEYVYRASSTSVSYDPLSGDSLSNAVIDLSIQSAAATPSQSFETAGFAMGIVNSAQYLTPISLSLSSALQNFPTAAGPDFVQINLYPNGATLGVVYNFSEIIPFAFYEETEVAQIVYSVNTSALAPNGDSITTPLNWENSLGDPLVSNIVATADGLAFFPDLVNAIVEIQPMLEPQFVRGDCNGDSLVNVADAIWSINTLFHDGPISECIAACDSNSDDLYDVSDVLFIFNFRFLDGPVPAAPYPGCGAANGENCDSSICP